MPGSTWTTVRCPARTRAPRRFAQEAGGVGSFEWYPAKGVLDVSDEFRRIWGLPPGTTVTDRMLIDMIEPGDRLLTGPSRLELPNPLQYVEYRIRRAQDGALRWVARRGVVMPALGPRPDRFLGVVIDITERKEVEDALRRSEARWRGLFEQMQEGFFIGELVRDGMGQAADFRFLELNPAFEQQTGLPWA
jgi:PAS domain S-box-containing protein